MSYLNSPVKYLVDSDLDSQGNIISPDVDLSKPALVMVQANFCGHCTMAKPAFQEFANNNHGAVEALTIQADGDQPGEKELGKRLNSFLPNFVGFPYYAVYKNGQFVKECTEGRQVQDLQNCVNSLQ